MGSWNSRQRWIGLAAAAFSFGLAALVGAGSCATLPTIDRNVCGNNVHEETEDCDGFPVLFDPKPEDAGPDFPKTACGAPSDPGACRYVCKYRGDYPVCPEKSGYGCGVDNICRVSTGLSTTPLSVAGGGALRLFSADFDGDHREDAVAIGETEITIHYFATSGFVDRSVVVPSDERKLPGIGDLDGDERADLVLNLGTGLGVLLGQEDRTLVTRSYPTRVLPPATKRIVPLGLGQIEGELLSFARNNDAEPFALHRIFPSRSVGAGIEPITLDNPVSLMGALSGAVGVSRVSFVDKNPCPRVAFVLEQPAQSTLYVLQCKIGGGWMPARIEETPLGDVKAWGGAFFADADGDGDEDLLYGVSSDLQGSTVYVRKNDGTVLGSPEVFAELDALACQTGKSLLGPPLAVGDLNGDGRADLVDWGGIWFQGDAPPRKCFKDKMVVWKAAIIGDFDGNGVADVLAARQNQAMLDFWGGVGGGTFNTVTVPAGLDVAELVGGDFDGDTIADAILRPAPKNAANGGSMGNEGPDAGAPDGGPPDDAARDIFVLFGKAFSMPDPPARLGELVGDAMAIVAGNLSGRNAAGESDPLTDLVILSSAPEAGGDIPLALIPGHPRRRLLAPLSLTNRLALDIPLNDKDALRRAPRQVLVSKFLSSYCKAFDRQTEPKVTPSTITAIDEFGANIWLAGCESNGLGKVVLPDEPNDDSGFRFLAPVYEDGSHDSLASFKGNTDEPATLTHIVPNEADGTVVPKDKPVIGEGPSLSLPPSPALEPFDVPFRYVDVDGDGRRDIALTAGGNGRAIVVYWNRGPGDGSIDSNAYSAIPIDAVLTEVPASAAGNTTPDRQLLDFVFINTDGDEAKELFVLTRTGLYFAEATQTENSLPTYALDPTPFYATPAAKALLAIDANSDGIEDLLLADDQKLQLFLGKEGVR